MPNLDADAFLGTDKELTAMVCDILLVDPVTLRSTIRSDWQTIPLKPSPKQLTNLACSPGKLSGSFIHDPVYFAKANNS